MALFFFLHLVNTVAPRTFRPLPVFTLSTLLSKLQLLFLFSCFIVPEYRIRLAYCNNTFFYFNFVRSRMVGSEKNKRPRAMGGYVC